MIIHRRRQRHVFDMSEAAINFETERKTKQPNIFLFGHH